VRGNSSKKTNVPAKKCLCDECPYGSGAPVKNFGLDAETYCEVAEQDADGRFVPGHIWPVQVKLEAELTACSRYVKFTTNRHQKAA
jgi:hypothetical protein